VDFKIQPITQMTKSKKEILADIKKTYQMKPVTVVIGLIATAFILGTIFHDYWKCYFVCLSSALVGIR
jgi:hypothetical protein